MHTTHPPLLSRLLHDRSGGSAVEFAAILPLMMVMLFGFIEAGRYIQDYHIVEKAVRDGVRYAARQPFAAFTCGGGAGNASLEATVKNYVRTGSLVGGTPRLPYWDAAAPINFNVTCDQNSTGIYTTLNGGAPVIEIDATVPYASLFGALSASTGLSIIVRAESPGMGI